MLDKSRNWLYILFSCSYVDLACTRFWHHQFSCTVVITCMYVDLACTRSGITIFNSGITSSAIELLYVYLACPRSGINSFNSDIAS